MPIKDQTGNRELWRSLALFGSASINLGVMVAGGFYLGRLLETAYHWPNMKIMGVLAGLILGFYEMFLLAYKSSRKK